MLDAASFGSPMAVMINPPVGTDLSHGTVADLSPAPLQLSL